MNQQLTNTSRSHHAIRNLFLMMLKKRYDGEKNMAFNFGIGRLNVESV
jgi:hypothetical protein